MKLSVQIREKFELGDVLHMTHIENLDSILRTKAIFSKTEMDKKNQEYNDISNESVQLGRSKVTIPCTNKELHEYVPFYWGRKTPMIAALQDQNEDIIFLQFHSDILEDNECVLSDGNARSTVTHFKSFTNLADLEFLDNKSINTVKYGSKPEVKRKKQSEVLVYNFIGLENLKCIICFNEVVKSKVKALISTHGVNCGVYVNAGAYYF